MKISYRICLLSLSFFCFMMASAGDTRPRIAAQPSWLTPVPVKYNVTHLDEDAIDGYSDLHYEQQVSLETKEVFYKKAFHILSEAGVENLSKLSVEYDPSFQQLSFHSVRVIRDNKIINQLDNARLKTIQQEKELGQNIYDGSLTALLILEDVRKNDIVEYSYTITGFNPIFQNKYATFLSTQYSFPVYNIYYKLIVPQGRSVTIKNNLTDVKASVSSSANGTAYEWQIKDQEPLHIEDGVPSWYDVYPTVMVSEFRSWSEINQWALQLFPFDVPVSGGLRNKINEIKSKYAAATEQVLAALRFVQDDIRYMGIEMGENSHKPHSPSQVFQQRFGDCKDKSYLLCTMLRQLGVEANPVFINTSYKKTVTTWLPSATVFDHTTVTAVVNGKTYWFDPTISHQRGSLDEISYPNYQVGLVIKPGSTGFTKIGTQDIGKVSTKETFYVKNMRGKATLVVTTHFTGSFADDVRYSFASKSNKELKDSYKDLYKSYFTKIDSDSLTYNDDEKTGEFILNEYYTIHDFWEEKNDQHEVLLQPYMISGILNKPEETSRTMPFAVTYPAKYVEDIEVHLPEDWPITESSHHFEMPGCSLNFSYTQVANDIIRIHYSYEATEDHVTPASTEEFTSQMEEANKIIAFKLYENADGVRVKSSSSAVKPTSNNFFSVAYTILACLAFGTFIYRLNQKKKKNYWE